MSTSVEPRSLVLDAEYNRGARDMAIIFLNVLRSNGGRILPEAKKFQLQFITLLEKMITQQGLSALDFVENQSAQGGFPDIYFERDCNGNFTGIYYKRYNDTTARVSK